MPSYPAYYSQTAEDEITAQIGQIRYGWGRIAEIAKRQQRLTGQ